MKEFQSLVMDKFTQNTTLELQLQNHYFDMYQNLTLKATRIHWYTKVIYSSQIHLKISMDVVIVYILIKKCHFLLDITQLF